jgi:integrase
VWTITLSEHKTAYQNRERVIHVGPKAQAVLRPYLLRAADSPCFSPRESEIERHALCATHRRAGQQRNPKATDRAIGDRYDVASYRRAISRACVAAGVPRWAPNQLRHAAATRVRKELGLEAAQVLLGHARADVTQVYAERDNALAREVALRLG